MAANTRYPEEGRELEGIVTYCDDRRALVWVEEWKTEKEISFAYRAKRFDLGDWLMVTSATDDGYKIRPPLQTRIQTVGSNKIVQVKTEVIFRDDVEKIGHGTIIESKHFGRVAVFTPFSGIVAGKVYSVFVERIPSDQNWNERKCDVYWFVPNQIPEIVRSRNEDVELHGPLTGVVVSKAMKTTFVWTPSLGEGICDSAEGLVVGKWIRFMADTRPEGHASIHTNIHFRVIEWKETDPILQSTPVNNNLMLTSTIVVPVWPLNNLEAEWIGPVTDREDILKTAVNRFGVAKLYRVVLKRRKKSPAEQITTWNVQRYLDCSDIQECMDIAFHTKKRAGIVRYVDYRQSVAFLSALSTNVDDGRELRVGLNVFQTVPELGDWFMLEIDENTPFWTVISATKSPELCNTRVVHGRLEVETDVVLTDRISAANCRIAYSHILGAVIDVADIFANMHPHVSKKYKVWCATIKAGSGQPRWRVAAFASSTVPVENRHLNSQPNKEENAVGPDGNSYVGIVVSKTETACFVWTPSLGEGICRAGNNLHIGDWIRFSTTEGKLQGGNLHFFVGSVEKIDSLYPAHKEDNTAVVTITIPVPKDHNSPVPPRVPFFGEVIDKRLYFGANFAAIRGHMIEIDIRRVKKSVNEPVTAWDIIYVKLKEPLEAEVKSSGAEAIKLNALPDISVEFAPGQSTNDFSTVDQTVRTLERLDFGERNPHLSYGIGERENQPTTNHNREDESEEHDEGYGDVDDEESVELDPVICSMKLLFMSKEVRDAIKENCEQEYLRLCELYGYVP